MRTLKLAILAIVLALASAIGVSAQQFTLTQTTLTADVTAAASTFQLASVTGIIGQSAGPGTGTGIYIDAEYASVISVNVTAKTIFVLRGMDGTKATGHKASNMVLFGSPNAFSTFNPAGTCIVAQVPAQPTINVNTSQQWLCSAVTLTWVPGFGNFQGDKVVTALVASAAGVILPSGPLFHVNGTAAITGFTTPTGCNTTVRGGCSFTIIPDAVFTWTAAGNIALAGTAVVNKALVFIWDATNSKWIPNYIA
jgi:hypothetical protein